MNEKYKKINNYLNIVFKELEKNDEFLLSNLANIGQLADRICDITNNYKINTQNHIVCDEFNPIGTLTYQDIYLKTRQIIEEINPKYLKDYDLLIQNGALNFDYENKTESETIYCDEAKLININEKFDYSAVPVLVHEYMHYKNADTKMSKNRYVLTEFISIYFELYTQNKLKEQGINIKNLDYEFRIDSLIRCCYSYNLYSIIFSAYKNFGQINELSVEDLKKYHIVTIDQEIMDKLLEKMLNIFEKIEKQDLFQTEEELGRKLTKYFKEDYRYIIGTILAYYAIKHCNKNDIVKMSDHINDEEYANKSVEQLLNEIGIIINHNNINEAINNIMETIEQLNVNKTR